MTISAITPNFQGNAVTDGIKRTIADPTDVRNKDAAIGGSVAAGGVSGTAVVVSRFKTMRNATMATHNFARKAAGMKAQNATILADLATNAKTFFTKTRATRWIARMMETAAAKKVGGALLGVTALGITCAQLFSAGDMAIEAVNTYKG